MSSGILGSRGNKLIAEFMDFETQSDFLDDRTTAYYVGNVIIANNSLNENDDDVFHPDDMRFHKEWNWLMPVIERIEQHHKGVPRQLINMSLYSRINEVYFAVIDYITEVRTCESCCYNIVDDNGDVMEHECIND